jgi:hypothetical protein
MSSWVSDKGKWHPAKEKIALTNLSDVDIKHNGETIKPGDPFIYEGPDRQAIKELHEEGVDPLGEDFRRDPDFIQMTRTRNFNSVDEYLEWLGYDEKAHDKKCKENMHSVKSHEIPKRAKEILVMGGGKDHSGNKNNDVIGGFGDQRERSSKELVKK